MTTEEKLVELRRRLPLFQREAARAALHAFTEDARGRTLLAAAQRGAKAGNPRAIAAMARFRELSEMAETGVSPSGS